MCVLTSLSAATTPAFRTGPRARPHRTNGHDTRAPCPTRPSRTRSGRVCRQRDEWQRRKRMSPASKSSRAWNAQTTRGTPPRVVDAPRIARRADPSEPVSLRGRDPGPAALLEITARAGVARARELRATASPVPRASRGTNGPGPGPEKRTSSPAREPSLRVGFEKRLGKAVVLVGPLANLEVFARNSPPPSR